MRAKINVFLWCSAFLALQASISADSYGAPEELAGQRVEDRWTASLAITSGMILQGQDGFADSVVFEDMDPDLVPLRGPVSGNDFAVAPFVGAALELMTPALPIPTRPRFFLSGEFLPTFGSERRLAVEGDPGCIRGPEPDAPCAADEDGTRTNEFGEEQANGKGTKTTGEIEDLVFGANFGVAFPFRVRDRWLQIKPSFGWINYGVEASGLVSDANCSPDSRCTTTTPFPLFPEIMIPGNLREWTLSAQDSKRFNGIGPGLDVEVDTGRFGPLGTALFLGGRAYRILGNRKIRFSASQSASFEDDGVPGMETAAARFEAEVDEWLYRGHVGIRFQWLGMRD